MNDATLNLVTEELAATIAGRRIGRVFQLSRLSFAIDLRDGSRFLFISAEPTAARLYLIRRRLRDIEKQSIQQLAFAQFLKKRISGATVESIEKLEGERVVVIGLGAETDFGERVAYSLIAQLTGRSANIFLADKDMRILDRVRETFGDGQEIGTIYAPPSSGERKPGIDRAIDLSGHETVSDALDAQNLTAAEESRFKQFAAAARTKIKQAESKIAKLAGKLRSDLEQHGDPEIWKRRGDLILANLADAVMMDGKLLVVDYFDESTPVVEIEIDENDSPTESAEKFFKRYTKARNAREELSRRLAELEEQARSAEALKSAIEERINDRDLGFLEDFVGRKEPVTAGRNRSDDAPTGTRRFLSADGFEILVGKGAKDNDQLTFRIARSHDLWLHAADYPGSHVIVRNPSKAEIPAATLLEAARFAAMYSQARSHPKAAVHYTLRKNVHKPRGGAPGLVSLTNFKTLIVDNDAPLS